MGNDRSPNTKPLHFLLVPLLAQGHMIPMVDLARLLAARGNLVTFATTPINLARIQPIVERATAAASTLQIRFIELRFCVADAGLPDGCENIDLLPSMDLLLPFLNSLHLLRDPLEAHLQALDPFQWPRPACLISDNIQNWTIDFARALDIPRLTFQGPSCFYLVCDLLINRHVVELEAAMVAASGGPIILPGLTQPIRISKHELMLTLRSDPGWFKLIETMKEMEETSEGILINSFVELESWYIERYHEEIGKPIWPIGPLSLYNEEDDAKAVRGRVSSIDNMFLLQWLDGKEPGSVVLVSFGSIAHNTMEQIVEIGHGIEASAWPFVWVVKEAAEGRVSGLGEWMTAFEKRVEGKGIVIKGWAPQTMILNHIAVGGFLTHCGWNSTLEAIAAGVVMATWPHFGDQFFNERLVVDVLKIGVAVGVEKPTMFGVENDNEAVVKVRRGEVEKVVEMLMEGGDEGNERRERARELKQKARMAMEKGGSSWKGLQDVINYVQESQKNKN
ncbi:hypothetical protein IEQ34_009032 [Dendrobium chrysotoxum]|uniref:Glycosyltransferase n=1 Tax=Dendrobium chrysotoxum TaxID=161865 RepID=A0AAV7GY57_DENCH|nr:hypothetical protein IEQ34_009032 [Dendrobium chrysotoxum]